jgi:nephrocystin-3
MVNRSPANKPTLNRVAGVFISSTFLDMQAEGDVLVKQVFPELKKRCRERFVEFVEVDLRWGVTEEQAKRGEVLPICLAQINRCRPYFIGLLGERYGWHPLPYGG